MALAIATQSLFAQLWFVREGTAFTVPTSGTTAREAKPGAGDSTVWNAAHLGDAEEFTITPEGETYVVQGGQPGGLVDKDEINLSQKLKITFGTQQLDPLFVQALFGTLTLTTASTQANPLEGKRLVKGWLKFQAYDADQVLRLTGEIWGSLRLTSAEPWSGKNIVKGKWEFLVLRSSLNTLGA